jgi:putative RNA 2'-phosphotransferase
MQSRLIRTSKLLSYLLRHRPDSIGLQLDAAGWADIDELIRCAAAHGKKLSHELIEEAVATNSKKRFALSTDRRRVRANQGHSIPIDLGLEPVAPPDHLYHGTATRFLDSIMSTGLQSRSRQHVHLSGDRETAIKVGQRHGKPVVLLVAAGAMADAGHLFYLSSNQVWLTIEVPAKYLKVIQT